MKEPHQPPNIITMAGTLGKSVANWATADDFSIISDELLKHRKEICEKCSYWDKNAYLGAGRCNICGCSGLKLYIPSSKCPLNPPKWTEVTVADHK